MIDFLGMVLTLGVIWWAISWVFGTIFGPFIRAREERIDREERLIRAVERISDRPEYEPESPADVYDFGTGDKR